MSTNPNPPPTRLQVEYALAPRLLDLLPDYERYLVAWGRRPRGIQRSLWILGRLFRQIGDDATLAQFTDEAIERYQVEMAAAGRTGATIGNMISCARSFARWALRRKLITTDPTANLIFPKKQRPAPRALHREQLVALEQALVEPPGLNERSRSYHRRGVLAVLLGLYGGLRIAEIASLRWRDVDLYAASLLVREGKGGKDRTIALHPRLLAALESVPQSKRAPQAPIIAGHDGMPLKVRSMDNLFRRWVSRAGLHFTAHQLRHSCATEMCRLGGDIIQIQNHLGHARLDTTMIYIRHDPERTRAAVNALPGTFLSPEQAQAQAEAEAQALSAARVGALRCAQCGQPFDMPETGEPPRYCSQPCQWKAQRIRARDRKRARAAVQEAHHDD